MDTHKIPTIRGLKSTSSGWRIFSREDLPSSTPISKISMDTTRPERYSIRPWPKGWWVSGFCPASWKPSSVTTEDPASERLLKASAVMAMEPERVPAKNFPAKSRTLKKMPTAPQRMP